MTSKCTQGRTRIWRADATVLEKSISVASTGFSEIQENTWDNHCSSPSVLSKILVGNGILWLPTVCLSQGCDRKWYIPRSRKWTGMMTTTHTKLILTSPHNWLSGTSHKQIQILEHWWTAAWVLQPKEGTTLELPFQLVTRFCLVLLSCVSPGLTVWLYQEAGAAGLPLGILWTHDQARLPW